MKNYAFLIVIFFLFAGFSNPNSPTDQDKSMETINGFYDAMGDFSYTQMDDYCTSNFSVIDHGEYFKNLGEFVNLVKTFEGATIDLKMEVKDSHFKAKSGLLIVLFDVDITMDDEKIHMTALESYVMKKEGGTWLIDFIHSTPIEQ